MTLCTVLNLYDSACPQEEIYALQRAGVMINIYRWPPAPHQEGGHKCNKTHSVLIPRLPEIRRFASKPLEGNKEHKPFCRGQLSNCSILYLKSDSRDFLPVMDFAFLTIF